MKARIVLFAVALIITATTSGLAQGGQRGQRGRPPAKPTPRTADGKVSFGPLPGELGVWLPGAGGAERLVDFEPGDATDAQFPIPAAAKFPGKITVGNVPFQPWSKELYNYRRLNQLEPHTRCKPSGGPRQFLTPYGVEFLELKELQRILVVDIGGPHTMRVIYLDGKGHPADLDSSYLGHSAGKWEGNTLVVDTVGYNERFWFDRWGLPHTQQLHTIERFTRLDQTTLKYEITVDDPGAYTAPWTSGIMLRWNPNQELFEYVCQDNNLAPQLMLGAAESIDRRSVVVP